MSTSSSEKYMEFVNRNFNAAENTRNCVTLKTRSEEMTQANSMVQRLILEVCKEKPKPIAVGMSEKAGSRLQVDLHLPSMGKDIFRFHRSHITNASLKSTLVSDNNVTLN